MVKKYKLIKEYPGSPKLNSIVEEFNLEHHRYYKLIDSKYTQTPHFTEIENYPEYWKEVKEEINKL